MISYKPFFHTIKKLGISQYKLINEYGFSTGTLDSLRQNKSMNTSTIDNICKKLGLSLDQVMIFIEDEKAEEIISCGKTTRTKKHNRKKPK